VGGEFDKLKLKVPWANPGTQGFGDPGMEVTSLIMVTLDSFKRI
jgi:hypothetical protein